MKIKAFVLLVALFIMTVPAWSAVSAPAGLTSTAISNNTATLSWNEDTTINQWYIYLGGSLRYQPNRSDTSVPSSGRRSYLLQGLPDQTSIVVTMRALVAGQPMSVMSSAITITAYTVPTTYFLNPPGVPILVSGSAGGGGGDATAANQVIGNASLSSIDGKLSAPLPVTITALPMAVPSAGMVAYTALSSVALTITITAASFIELACGPGAAAGYKMQITNSVVAPWNITTGAQVGNYVASTTTTQVWAKKPGWLHIAGQGATAAPWVQIDPVQ